MCVVCVIAIIDYGCFFIVTWLWVFLHCDFEDSQAWLLNGGLLVKDVSVCRLMPLLKRVLKVMTIQFALHFYALELVTNVSWQMISLNSHNIFWTQKAHSQSAVVSVRVTAMEASLGNSFSQFFTIRLHSWFMLSLANWFISMVCFRWNQSCCWW